MSAALAGVVLSVSASKNRHVGVLGYGGHRKPRERERGRRAQTPSIQIPRQRIRLHAADRNPVLAPIGLKAHWRNQKSTRGRIALTGVDPTFLAATKAGPRNGRRLGVELP